MMQLPNYDQDTPAMKAEDDGAHDNDLAQFINNNEPCYETEFVGAKSYLQRCSTFTGDNLYDHLTDVLNKILAERPENVIDFFEEYSRKVKERRFQTHTDHFDDIYVPSGRLALANKIIPMLKSPIIEPQPSTIDPDDLDLADMSQNDMLHLLYYFEQSNLGLPRTEMLYITIAIKQLIHHQRTIIATIRFWGKIYGTERNYLIVETELKDDEYVRKNQQQHEEAITKSESLLLIKKIDDKNAIDDDAALLELIKDGAEGEEEDGGDSPRIPITFPELPKNLYKEPPEPPEEPSGVGLNKKVYYVCNGIGDPWIQLPDIHPKQIRIARQIHRNFTGYLDREIQTYPEFPGTERNLLRAQIARITASTQISPLGFYVSVRAGDNGEGGEDGTGGGAEDDEQPTATNNVTEFKENPKYDPLPLKDLIDPAMLFWVHHSVYILPQGRTTWWNPEPLPLVEQLDEEDDMLGEGGEDADAKPSTGLFVEAEHGPALLTPCSEDIASLEGMASWSVRQSSTIVPDFALAVARSNYWPGAYCLTTQGKLFQNVYLGAGTKYVPENFSPAPLPPVEQDYIIGPEILELALDPTGAEEEAWRIAHLPKIPEPRDDKMGEEEENLGDEEDEEEDDD